MKKVITIKNIEELDGAATELLHYYPTEKIFAFYGEMGVGKTTFIKALCKKLGVKDNTSSPTFSIINEYHAARGEKIYHFDFYRIKNENELYDLGYEEYFYSNNYCFIEWPEKIENMLPAFTLKIKLHIKKNIRYLSLSK